MADILSVGVSGLTVSQSALKTTGNNIANANTPGFSRQRVNFETQPEQYAGVGYLGSGAKVQGVQRIVDQIYIGQLRADTSTYNALDAMTTQLGQLDSLFADQSTGLSPTLQQLFSDLQQASQDPTSIPVRQVVLSDLGSLAQRFNTLYTQLDSQSKNVNQRFDDLTGQANSLAQSIAKLNQSIVEQGGATGTPPNALLDQREEVMRQLSEIVGVSAVEQSDGMINVFIGSGQPLVIGNRANTLSIAPSPADVSQQTIQLSAGSSSYDVTPYISGGQLGGLVSFQKNTLSSAYNTLGRIAISLADAVNHQQQLGVDLNGNPGTNIFTDINTASAMSARALRSVDNVGTGLLQVQITDASALTTSDYRLDFTSATGNYQLTHTDGSALTPPITGTLTLPVVTPTTITTPDGFDIQIAAGSTFSAGDSYTIQPTRLGAQAINVALQAPQQLAFAQPMRTATSATNQGSGAISQGTMVPEYAGATPNVTPAAISPTLPLSIQFTTSTQFQILDSTATPIAGGPFTFVPGQNNIVQIDDAGGGASYQFTLVGNPAAGDSFSVVPNANGSSDNRNALALAGLSSTGTISKYTFSQAYGQLVSDVGAKTSAAKNNLTAADTLLTQSQANRDAVSGVNLDEEAANLIKFQQAYQASAQVISIARTLFNSLLSAFQ